MTNLRPQSFTTAFQSSSLGDNLEALRSLRKVLGSSDDPPIDAVVQLGAIPMLANFLSAPNEEIVFESAWWDDMAKQQTMSCRSSPFFLSGTSASYFARIFMPNVLRLILPSCFQVLDEHRDRQPRPVCGSDGGRSFPVTAHISGHRRHSRAVRVVLGKPRGRQRRAACYPGGQRLPAGADDVLDTAEHGGVLVQAHCRDVARTDRGVGLEQLSARRDPSGVVRRIRCVSSLERI